MKLKGIELKGSYKLICFNNYFDVFDIKGNKIYHEYIDGFWFKKEYDENSKLTYYENSNGDWFKKEYDKNGNQIYFEDSDGYEAKWVYDENGNEIYYENSDGYIVDNRPKELTIEEIEGE